MSSPVMLRKFDSGVKVIQTKTHSDDEVSTGKNRPKFHHKFKLNSPHITRHNNPKLAVAQRVWLNISGPSNCLVIFHFI